MPAKRKVLVVDDEDHIVELLEMSLRQNGYETVSVADGTLVQATVVAEKPDLVLLDLMLPGIGGLEVCRLLRQDKATAGIPVIMLTAKSEEIDKVIGLGIGADDYVTKPFSLRELLARIEAVLRRGSYQTSKNGDGHLMVGGLALDVAGHSAWLHNQPLSLSPTEFTLLSTLADNLGRTVRRSTMLSEAGISGEADSGRSLDVHIRNLRRKLGDGVPGSPSIVTVRGVGYTLHG
jgi:DNA-binding response OmpR family regulator